MEIVLSVVAFISLYIIVGASRVVPVVYIVFDDIPEYFLINIELAARRNTVYVITDVKLPAQTRNENAAVIFEDIRDFAFSAIEFSKVYKHLMVQDHSDSRRRHELQCYQRWFVLKDFMKTRQLEKVLFGDGDSSIFVDADKIWESRGHCDAVINVPGQEGSHFWVAAGESSLWSLVAITEFCEFTASMYLKHSKSIETKWRHGSNVVDMSLLWLWWVSHHKTADWDAGRPWFSLSQKASERIVNVVRSRHDNAVEQTAKLSMAPISQSVRLCNGLDVVNRTVFDHMHGWLAGPEFSLNLDGDGVPSILGPCGHSGGRPESMNLDEVTRLSQEKLFFNNLHYQGDSKKQLVYDVCRLLTMTGSRNISGSTVRSICKKTLDSHPGLPCVNHIGVNEHRPPFICV